MEPEINTSNSEHLEDQDMEELFSAFDSLRADEGLKANTLAFIEDARLQGEKPADEPVEKQSDAPRFTATRGRIRLKAVRILAAAACVAALSIGGVAYATPSAYVTVADEDSSVELGVNCFGIVVSGSSDDDMGKEVLDQAQAMHRPYEDSLDRVIVAYEAQGEREAELAIDVRSDDARRAEDLEQRGENVMRERNPEGTPAELGNVSPEPGNSAPDSGNSAGLPATEGGDQGAGQAPLDQAPDRASEENGRLGEGAEQPPSENAPQPQDADSGDAAPAMNPR